MLNESYIIIFCRATYFDMLSMQHCSKQDLNKIYFFYFWWFPRGIHDIRYQRNTDMVDISVIHNVM